ncbi:hypothetical protein DSECCO2_638990 [anaerobic digester metagenome]
MIINNLEDNKENAISIYPNPTNGIINIENSEEIIQINVYNSIGDLVYSKLNHENNTEIDLSNKPKGIYFIELISKDKTFKDKIIIE